MTKSTETANDLVEHPDGDVKPWLPE